MKEYTRLDYLNAYRSNGNYAGPHAKRICHVTFVKARTYKVGTKEYNQWYNLNSYLTNRFWFYKYYKHIGEREFMTERKKVYSNIGCCTGLQYIRFYMQGKRIDADLVYQGRYWTDLDNFIYYDVKLRISDEKNIHNYTEYFLDWKHEFSIKSIQNYLIKELGFDPLPEFKPRGITDKKETVTQLSLF